MTVSELIDKLLDACDNEPEEFEVRLMTQPQWPFEHSVSGAVSFEPSECEECGGTGFDQDLLDDGQEEDCSQCDGSGQEDRGNDFDGSASPTKVVFILEGSQERYGDKSAWERN